MIQPGLHHMAWQLGSFGELQAAYRELKALGVGDGFEAMQTLRPKRDPLDLA